jgi:hypothetical protein
MSGIYTFTVEPTAETVVWGLVRHAYLIAALTCLAGLLFTPQLLEDESA